VASVAADLAGDVVMAGTFTSTLDLPGAGDGGPLDVSQGNTFLAKLNGASGDARWAEVMVGASAPMLGQTAPTDFTPVSPVVATGTGGAIFLVWRSEARQLPFVEKIDPNGRPLWRNTYSAGPQLSAVPTQLAMGRCADDFFIAGNMDYAADPGDDLDAEVLLGGPGAGGPEGCLFVARLAQ
jgi:hypothetical protein